MSKLRWIFAGRWALLTAPLACALPLFILALMVRLIAIMPWGSELLFTLGLFAMGAIAFFALGISIAASIGLCFPQTRRAAPRFFWCAVVSLLAIRLGVMTGQQICLTQCLLLAKGDGFILVKAIHAYERQYKRPPPALNALVPEFLPSLPRTEIGACPDFEYATGEYAGSYGREWTLSVSIPSNLLETDTLLYYPRSEAAEQPALPPYERLRDWVYIYAD
jgi:hypothetical protein